MSNLLSLIVLPFISALIALALGALPLTTINKQRINLILSLLPLAVLILGHNHWNGAEINVPWISTLGINFHLAVDSLSMLFVVLAALIIPLAVYIAPTDIPATPFYFLTFILQAFLFILFTSRDLILFTIAWEAILLPLYFIITFRGGEHRHKAALQFLIYMIAGSALLIAAVLGLYFTSPLPTFNFDQLAVNAAQTPYAVTFFFIFMLAFAVKTPLFPFHGWLPETYMQAPFAGTILLSALLSKAGIYGIARIGFEFFPSYIVEYSPFLLTLAIFGALYGALAAWTQNDYKRLIAYSSFSHVNFILVGLFVASETALQGAALQAFNHGITIAALFLVAYWLKQRVGTTSIDTVGGVAKSYTRLCWLTLFFVLASIALPSTNNFVGELIILYALFKKNVWLAALLTLTIILSAIYMLRWMQKVYFGEPKNLNHESLDIGMKEILATLPLIAIILGIGIFPAPVLNDLKGWAEINGTPSNLPLKITEKLTTLPTFLAKESQ